MSYVAELWLYHGLPATGLFRFSGASSGGPWTDFAIDASKPVQEALAELAAEIASALTLSVTIAFDANANAVVCTADGQVWIWLTSTLADLLGFSTTIVYFNDGAPAASDQTPLGIVGCEGISMAPPTERESSELREYRGGRPVAYPRNRFAVVRAQVAVLGGRLQALEGGTLMQTGRMRLSGPNADPFGPDDLDGYHDAWPLQTLGVTWVEGEDDLAVVTLDVSVEDP